MRQPISIGSCRKPRRIHDLRRRDIRAAQGRRTKATGWRSEKTIVRTAVPAMASRKCAAKRKNKSKTPPLTTCAFIHDVSPLFRCRAPCFFSRSPQLPMEALRRSKAAPKRRPAGVLFLLLVADLRDDQVRVGDVQRCAVLGELHFQHILLPS